MGKLFGIKKKEKIEDESLNSFSNVTSEVVDEEDVMDVDNSSNDSDISTMNQQVIQDTPSNEFNDSTVETPNFYNVETTYTNNNGKDGAYTWVDNTGKTGEDIQNPVYDSSLDPNDKKVSGNILACLLVFLEIFLSPGKSIIANTERYVKGKKSIKVFLHILIFLIIISLVGRICAGCFIEKYIPMKRDYGTVFDFNQIANLNYISVGLFTFIFTIGIIFIVTAINYATSFFSSKGLSFDTYLLINTLSIAPFTIGINVIYPFVSVISIKIAIVLLIISFIYTLLIYVNALFSIMEFSSDNRRVIYMFLNFVIIVVATFLLISMFFSNSLDEILKVLK